jgi:hypothetical protein
VGVATSTEHETSDQTHRCYECDTELPLEASFCNVCGSDQRSKVSSKADPPSEMQVTIASVEPDKILSGSSRPQKLLLPTRRIHPGIKAPKTSIQPDESRSVSSSTLTSSTKAENISNIATQHLEEPSSPTRTTGLSRPISSKSPMRLVIPSRPDLQGTSISTQQLNQTPETPGYSLHELPVKISPPSRPQTQQGASSSDTLPGTQDIESLPTSHLSTDYTNGKNSLADTPTMNLLSPESFVATRKAAEHWRKSWLDRQYAEAGPAVNVSRGQASVQMPLLSKQQSFAHMRAVASNNQEQQYKSALNFRTWCILFLMICLIVGLGAYIIWSYLPNSPFGITHTMPQVNATQPTLSTQGARTQTVIIGQTILLHGEHFGPDHTINFLLDSATYIVDASGVEISTQTNSHGTFYTTFAADKHWTTGVHSIEAVDISSNLIAFITLQVIPAGTPTTKSSQLSVRMDNKAVQMLTFKTDIGQANPEPLRITIENISKAPLNWSATASSSNNLSWLTINDDNTSGHLDISQPHDILISANIVGLKSTSHKKPYAGQIIFTINNNQLLTVPVQLEVSGPAPEMVFSPNPIIVHGQGNTCNAGATLTLINLGTVAISWTVNPDEKDNIKFINNGQILESGILLPSGSLLPSGQPGDSVVLNLQCNAIRIGHQYHVSVYANQKSWSEFVIVQ